MRLRGQRRRFAPSAGPGDISADNDAQRRPAGRDRRAVDVPVDRVAAALATAQDGVFERNQLLAHGVSEHAIDRRVRTGRFIVLFRGVYTVGHAALSTRGRIRAALLAGGPRAVASHHAAAALHGLLPSLPPFVDITVKGSARRSRPGLRIHRSGQALEIVQAGGLPVTTPLRTLQDLRGDAGFERLCADALHRNLVSQEQLEAARLLAPGEAAPTRSVLERRLLALVRAAGLPRPRVNHTIGPYEVDFAWIAQRVVVEVDGWQSHGHRLAFERDRARDAELVALGYVVLRFTWRQVRDDPLLVAARIAQALATRTATSTAPAMSASGRRWTS